MIPWFSLYPSKRIVLPTGGSGSIPPLIDFRVLPFAVGFVDLAFSFFFGFGFGFVLGFGAFEGFAGEALPGRRGILSLLTMIYIYI
jgi:hypothetical protein